MIVDQSKWGRLRVTGNDRQRFLQGMLSNDVGALTPGAWCRATLLNVKGRVQAIVDVLHQGDSYLLVTEPVTAAAALEILERHAIVDDVAFESVDVPVHRVWESVEAVWTAPPVTSPLPGPAAGDAEVEVRRVEAGLPRFGVDVSDEYFPFEANLERAISLKKGCYIGQEVVARADARGSVKKRLVGLRVDGEGPVPAGATVEAEARPEAGAVTSSVVSPSLGPIALAYVHKSCWEPGTAVTVAGRSARVVGLPFVAG